MKKKYIVPQTKARLVRPAQIIAYSGPQIQEGYATDGYGTKGVDNSDVKGDESISIWGLY